jgi:hypothetical protein
MGETALDEQIFEEYLAEMRDHYTADKVCFLSPRLLLLGAHNLVPYSCSIIFWVNDHRRANARQQLAHDIDPV